MNDKIIFQKIFLQSEIPSCIFEISEIKIKCDNFISAKLIDIDKLIYSEILLKQQSEKLLNLIDANYAFIYLVNAKNYNELFISDNFLYKSLLSMFVQIILSELISKNKAKIVYEYDLNFEDKKRYFRIYINFIEEKNSIYAYFSIIENTAQKKSEIIASEYIEKYFILLKSIEDSLIVVDIETDLIIEANDNTAVLFESELSYILGNNHKKYFKKDNLSDYINFYNNRTLGLGDEVFQTYITIKNERKIPVKLKINCAVVGGKKVAQIIIHDLRSRYKIEERRKLLATAVDQSAESILIADTFGKIRYVNPSFENISGFTYSEVFNKNIKIFLGSISDKFQYNAMWQEVSCGNVWQGTFKSQKKNNEIYYEDATITPVKDNDGKIINYVIVKRDITQRRIAENQIRQSQKMQAIGTLAGGVAHDFNNILTAILGFAELSQGLCEKGSLIFNNLDEIIKASERAGQLVDQILKFSRQSEKNLTSVQVSLIIQEVIKLLKASLPANIILNADISDDLFVKADPTQIHQILMNLCTNAYQALGNKGGLINIRLFKKKLTPKEGVAIGNLQHGYYACLQIIDNGIGIPEEYIHRIFEPYFTTKSLNEGTGLGLSVVHGIINDNCGAITVSSQPGRGSCFSVYLPLHEKKNKSINKEQNIDFMIKGNILVVDDEEPIVIFISKILKQIGLTVDTCTDSTTASNIIKESLLSYDLIISDMGMPGISGLELSRLIKNINSKFPVIICTGYSQQINSDNYMKLGIDGYLHKPFNAQMLIKEVLKVINISKNFQ